jgi:GTP-binding nuclear protein Ran
MNYKILLVGDANVGKSAYLERVRTGKFEKEYLPTMGVDVFSLIFSTNYGNITFKVWDCAGQEKFGGLKEGHKGANGAICMIDLTNRVTLNNMPRWIDDIEEVLPNIPIILCGNKFDIKYRKVEHNQIEDYLPAKVNYYDISAKSNHNIENPWVDLARQLTGHPNLKFITQPAINPPEVKELVQQKQINWVKVPGGKMKVTYEFYEDDEI